MNQRRKWLTVLAVCAVVFALDRVTKELARVFLAPSEGNEAVRVLEGLLYLRWSTNDAGFFGFLDGVPDAARWAILLIGTGLFVALLLWILRGAARTSEVHAVSLILAGVLGNGFDRLIHGTVIDCIFVTWMGTEWRASVNIADLCIGVGFMWYVVVLFASPVERRSVHEAA